MKPSRILIAMLLVSLFFVPTVLAQSPDSGNQSAASPALSASAAEVPRLIKFSGTLLDAQDQPLAGPVGVTFALYAQQSGGAALWLETQNVKPDTSGTYTVLLGANSAKGVPAELFISGEARWLEVQVERQAAHERILLVSVPYALKAGDAETLGGKPASAYLTTETVAGAGNSAAAATPTAASSTPGALPKSPAATTAKKAAATPLAACSSVTSGGAAPLNAIAKFTGSCSVDGSAITEVGGNVGIGTTTPAAALHVNGNTLLVTSATTAQLQFSGSASTARFGQDLNGAFFASDSKGKAVRFYTNNGTLNEGLRITSAGNVGIGTQTPAAALDVAGSINLPFTTGAMNGAILMGGASGGRFAHDFGGAFLGSAAGNFTMTGFGNAGIGDFALAGNTAGNQNTAAGNRALAMNTTGIGNTAVGGHAGVTANSANANTTGSNNTFIGRTSGPATPTQLTNATAIGANALVNCSNCMVLGDSTMPMNVGIGTNTPAFTLDVAGTGNFTGNTTTANTAIVSATQSGTSATAFNFTPATVPPAAVGGVATATSGTVVGVGGISNSPAGAGMGAINFSTAGGAAIFAFSAGAADKSSAVEALQSGTSFATRGVHVDVLSPSGVSGLFDNSASGDLLIGRSGPSGSRVDEFHVYGNGNVTILGNFHSATAGDGIILKSPDGTLCKLLGIANTTGAITLTTVTCPAAP